MGFYTNKPDLEPSEAVTAAVHVGLNVHKDTVVVLLRGRSELQNHCQFQKRTWLRL